MNFCTACGQPTSPNDLFCTTCGAKLEVAPTITTTPLSAVSTPKQKSPSTLFIGIGILIIGVAGWYIFSHKNTPSTIEIAPSAYDSFQQNSSSNQANQIDSSIKK